MSSPTWEQCFDLLGLEQPDVFAERMLASEDRKRWMGMLPEHERERRAHQQTGRTTSQLVWVAWHVSRGKRAIVWCLPGHRWWVKGKLGEMVRRIDGLGAVNRVRVLGRKPTYQDVCGAENVVLSMDHAVQDVWDREVIDMARAKGWEVG